MRVKRQPAVVRSCEVCHKEIRVWPSIVRRGGGRFCSYRCRAVVTGTTLRKKRIRICELCGKEYRPAHRTITRYCGRQCSALAKTKHHLIIRKCESCGRLFMCRPQDVERGFGLVCSRQCNGVRSILRTPKQRTSIEVAVGSVLDELAIPYKPQVPIGRWTIADFLLPGHVVIQCDGDYWHGSQKVKNRDANQDLQLNFMGYLIIRLKEKDIRSNPKRCVARAIKTIAIKLKGGTTHEDNKHTRDKFSSFQGSRA
jgi:very-short-patch-repair endonuclease